jgi:glycopeptide antibiotics resistance protein
VGDVGWWGERRVLVALALGYVVALAVLVGGPWGWALNRLTVTIYVQLRYDWPIAPDWVLPEHYGVLLNVLLFVPLGALFVLLARRPWWLATAFAAAGSLAIEAVQWLWLDRQGTWSDVAANTLGAAIGAVGVGLAVSLLARRR